METETDVAQVRRMRMEFKYTPELCVFWYRTSSKTQRNFLKNRFLTYANVTGEKKKGVARNQLKISGKTCFCVCKYGTLSNLERMKLEV
jgi:hypothetical protein